MYNVQYTYYSKGCEINDNFIGDFNFSKFLIIIVSNYLLLNLFILFFFYSIVGNRYFYQTCDWTNSSNYEKKTNICNYEKKTGIFAIIISHKQIYIQT